MNKEAFTFELLDKYTPDIVFKNLLKQIEEATNGYVVGSIETYVGGVFPYSKTNELTAALNSFNIQSPTAASGLQEKLGEQGVEHNTFEVFLKVKWLEHYKYRMMFVRYGTISYPVTVMMNEELAVEYNGKRNTIFLIKSMKELEDMIDKVINSNTLVSLIQNLINESLRQEAKGEVTI